jgi:hypothetical protein
MEKSRLTQSKEGWMYKNRVAEDFGDLSFWSSVPETVPVKEKGKLTSTSLDRIDSEQVVTMIINQQFTMNLHLFRSSDPAKRCSTSHNLSMNFGDFLHINEEFLSEIFHQRKCSRARLLSRSRLALDWTKVSKEELTGGMNLDRLLFDHENANLMAINVGYPLHRVLLNIRNPMTKWLVLLRDTCAKGIGKLGPEQFERTLDTLVDGIGFPLLQESLESASNCIKGWQETTELPSELRPPANSIRSDMIIDIKSYYANKSRR